MKKLSCILVVLSVLLTSISSIDVNAAQGTVSNPIIDVNHISKFDVITFGNYWQDDFKRKDPIRWIVLEVKGNDMYCISEKVLASLDLQIKYEGNLIDYKDKVEKSYNSSKKLYDEMFSESEKYDVIESEKGKNLLLTNYYDFEYLKFLDNISTRYNGDNFFFVFYGPKAKKIGPVFGPDDYRLALPLSDGKNTTYSDPISGSTCGVRPAIHIRKASKLWKKIGVIGENMQYFSPKATKISKIKSKKRKLKITWRKKGKTDGVMGYKLQYSTSKKFKKAKTVTIYKAKSKTKTIKKLKSKKKYFVRIRTYSDVNDKRYYSKWSKVKSKKTK